MRKLFPILLIVVGMAFVGGGGYTIYRGFDARDQVREELLAQNITTPEDASIPNVRVDDAESARSMAEIIGVHSEDSTGGLTYAELGRFMAADGDPAGTSDESAALIGDNGEPVPNGLRNVAFQAASLRTSLYTSVMAFEVTNLVLGIGVLLLVLGLAVGGVGVALGGLVIPALARKVHVEPLVAEYHPTAS